MLAKTVGNKVGLRRGNSSEIYTSQHCAPFTSTPSPSLDQTLIQESHFREEEKLRKLRRNKLRREALAERISLMQDSMATDISRQHEMTLNAFESERGKWKKSCLVRISTLTREEIRLREMRDAP